MATLKFERREDGPKGRAARNQSVANLRGVYVGRSVMHSPHYLQSADFRFAQGDRVVGAAEVFPAWSPADRLVVIAPDPAADLVRTAGLVLAWTQRFYDRPAARAPGFYDYPGHYVVGGEAGAEPRVVGPSAEAWWSGAWCRLDVWPSIRHIVADPDPLQLLGAALMLEPTVLVWPARLPVPASMALPPNLDDRNARRLLRARLRAVWRYGDEALDASVGWALEWGGGAAQLTREALDRLGDVPRADGGLYAFLERVEPDRFLGLA